MISKLGFNSSGKAAGASAAGTSDIDKIPVKFVPSGFFAVFGGTVRVTPIVGFVTTVVLSGSTPGTIR